MVFAIFILGFIWYCIQYNYQHIIFVDRWRRSFRLAKIIKGKWQHFFVMGTLMGLLAAFLFIGVLLLTQLIQIARNETSIEGMIESDILKAKFDKGSIYLNFKDYFGSDIYWYEIMTPFFNFK